MKKKILSIIAGFMFLFGIAGQAMAYMEYSFQGTVQAGSGYKMGSAYTTPLFNIGDTVQIKIGFNEATNRVLALDFTAGTYHHRMDNFSAYTVVSGPVFDYNSATGRMVRADVRFNETTDNYPYWFIKYVDGSSNPTDKWFVFNTYTNNDTVNGFSLNTFTYTDRDRLQFTGAQAVPIPGALWLLGTGLFGLIGVRKKFATGGLNI